MKKIIFYVIYSITIFSTHAEITDFERRGEDIYLTGDSCLEVDSEVSEISKWSKWSDNTDCATSKKNGWWIFSSGSCEANITKCLPEHVRRYHHTRPEQQGPNCWNLSLVMANILPNLRYSTPEEMNFFMQPPLCRALNNDETRRPGDIGAIRNSRGDEIHGFVYVSKKIAYSKNGFSNRSPYALQTLDNVYKVYGIKDKDKEKCLNNKMSKECSAGVEYFRCISMTEYLEQEKDTVENDQILSFINKADCITSKITFNKNSILEDQTIETITTSLSALNKFLDTKTDGRKIASLSEPDKFLIASSKLRISAMQDQLSMNIRSSDSELNSKALFTLYTMFENSKRRLDEVR